MHLCGDASVCQRMMQVWSRFTWELPQTVVGFLGSQSVNMFGQVEEVDYYGGATTVTRDNENVGGITLGSYIIGGSDLEADPENHLFQHEFGHYLQSRKAGLFYLPTAGLESLTSAINNSYADHGLNRVEQDANALSYFMEYEDGFTIGDWEFIRANGGHPIAGFDPNLPYDSDQNQAALSDANQLWPIVRGGMLNHLLYFASPVISYYYLYYIILD